MSWLFRKPKHEDEEKVRAVSRNQARMRRLIELGDETAFVAFVKELNPLITRQELIAAIHSFRDQHQQHLHGLRHPS